MKIDIAKRKHIILSLLLISSVGMGILVVKDFHSQIHSEFIVEDFVAYWASGRLLLAGNNPYSSKQLFSIEQSVGWTGEAPLLTYNPPWGISFVLPFCTENYATGKFLWLLFNIALVLLSIGFLWRFYAGTNSRFGEFLIFLTFAPIFFMVLKGQIVPLVLLGVVTFLYFEKYQQNFLAGIATILISIKPHIGYLFWVALLLWTLERSRWYLLFGGGVVFLMAVIIPLIYNPNIIIQYVTLQANQPPVYYWATPTVGTYLRLLFGWQRHWLQFIPTILGTIWFLSYWLKHRKAWEWDEQMPLILLMSLLTTYYVWVNDYIMILPAVIHGAVWVSDRRRRLALNWVIMAYISINGLAWAMRLFITQNEQRFIWMVPAFLGIYLVLRRQIHRNHLIANSIPKS